MTDQLLILRDKSQKEHHWVLIVCVCVCVCQVDAMKLGVKEMKKEFKKVNLDEIEV
jgi:hypothetical protein